ncbi:hypothetical protein ACNJ69_18440 [Acinetobacter soli]|uniref:hypothetical protein n=1 Tax=Acinetobacter soli TaxID=487316 RepID=UPI003BA14ED5
MSTKKSSLPKKKVVQKTTMIIQLDDDLKEKFQDLCKKNDVTCSQAIRRFMKHSVENYRSEQLRSFLK